MKKRIEALDSWLRQPMPPFGISRAGIIIPLMLAIIATLIWYVL